MSKSSSMRKCPHCEGAVFATKKEQSSTVGGTRFVAEVPAYSCRKCRAIFWPGRALERFDLEVACAIAVRGPANGENLRALRKALGLRAMNLAGLLQVTAETMSRWERGQRGVDPNAWITVGSLVLEKAGHPTATLARLEGLARPVKAAATVHVDLEPRRRSVRVKVTRGGTVPVAKTEPRRRSVSAVAAVR